MSVYLSLQASFVIPFGKTIKAKAKIKCYPRPGHESPEGE
jgi:hypothetical protein